MHHLLWPFGVCVVSTAGDAERLGKDRLRLETDFMPALKIKRHFFEFLRNRVCFPKIVVVADLRAISVASRQIAGHQDAGWQRH